MTTASPAMPFRRILAAVDGSDHGLHAARVAAALGRALRAHVTILTVYHGPSAALGEPNYSAALGEALDQARDIVDRARAAATGVGDLDLESEWLAGPPAETIMAAARDGAYDLIVLGTRGRSPVQAALLGSVSATVAGQAGRPVLIVPDGS